MGAGLPVPQKVMVHGLWMSGGRKMSKRLGNGVDIGLLDRHFTHDAVRYYCLAEMGFGQDGDFTYGALVDRANADLANGIGNLASRTLTMLAKYFDGVLPQAGPDSAVRTTVEQATATAVSEFENFEFRRGIEAIRSAMAAVDRYISDTKPWAIAKDAGRRDELAVVLVTAFEALRAFVVVLAPALPEGSAAIWRSMNLDGSPSDVDPGTLQVGVVPAGHRIGEIAPVFPRLNKEQIMDDITKETAVEGAPTPEAGTPPAATAPAPEPAKTEPDYITIDDFAKVELRVGQVLAADRIEGADKLLKLSVDLGEAEPRQVLAGIAMHYAPETLIGRKIVVCSNLKPRKMRGLESQGMILAASVGEDGVPVLATFTEDVPNGVRLK
jgi:methionyl-tRNA synthetase